MNTSTFRTAVIRRPGGPDSIEIVQVPVVEPGVGEVRVAVAAAPINPVDLGVASGFFHGLGLINQTRWTGLGWDFAGTVVATGPGVHLSVGARVAGMVGGFDRDFGTYAEQLVVPAADVALVPDDLDLAAASTVPLNGLAAAQIVDLLGDGLAGRDRLLVTGAAGAVGAYAAVLAPDRRWRVTGLARAEDEEFVRSLGADFTTQLQPGWDAVADGATMQEQALALVRDGGAFVGLRPNAVLGPEREIRVAAVETHTDASRLQELLVRAAAGTLPTRVHSIVPLDDVADALRAMAKGGIRGRIVLQPST